MILLNSVVHRILYYKCLCSVDINVLLLSDTTTSESDVTATSYIAEDHSLVTDAPSGTTLPSTLAGMNIHYYLYQCMLG